MKSLEFERLLRADAGMSNDYFMVYRSDREVL